MTDPRQLLAKYGLRAKKSWGQNFLVAENVYQAIVRATVLEPGDWVVEIGAGLGTLTARLAAAAGQGRVIAVERDPDMVTVLREELGSLANVEIRAENALTFDYGAIGRKVAVVGNLPYQIASPLLFHMLEHRVHIGRAVVMLQKEMADRIVAKPDTDAYGALGVMITTYADVRPVVRARAGAFHPPPKVDSAVIEIVPLPSTRAPISDEKRYSRVVHAAFNQRRKTLRNALKAVVPEAERALADAGIDGGRRGETLSVEEFARLAEACPSSPK